MKADCDAKKLTVTGNVDPAWLRERVEIKTKKKVDLISPLPQPKNDAGVEKKVEGEKKVDDDDKKPKEVNMLNYFLLQPLSCHVR